MKRGPRVAPIDMARFVEAVKNGLTNRELATRFAIHSVTASKLAAPLRDSARSRKVGMR